MRVCPSLGFYFVITIIIIFPFPLGGNEWKGNGSPISPSPYYIGKENHNKMNMCMSNPRTKHTIIRLGESTVFLGLQGWFGILTEERKNVQ